MGSRLAVEVTEVEGFSHVRLAGIVDEDNDLAEAAKRVQSSTVIVNSADVERINSCGVRDWVTWLGDLDRAGRKIYLIENSPAMMSQVNLVNNFIGRGTIVSFYAPYFCGACEADKMLLISVEEACASLPFRAPTCRCDQCDHTMEFDDIESSYFSFLSAIEKPRVEGKVAQVIARLSADQRGAIRRRAASIPVGTLAGTTSTPSQPSSTFPSMPTAPSSRDLRGLLTDISMPADGRAPASAPQGAPGKVLYVVIGLLLAAIGLLAFVLVRSR
ncbi:MAG: hypothetical protein IT371_02530 [Deltaproteobacteria bacterium]|nr:hypothetical protein [Deltaproteobacteria bacterium]